MKVTKRKNRKVLKSLKVRNKKVMNGLKKKEAKVLNSLNNMKHKKRNLGVIQIILAYVVFSAIPTLVRFENNFGALNLVFFRAIFIPIAIIIFLTLRRKKITPFKEDKKKLIVLGLTFAFIDVAIFIAIDNLLLSSSSLLVTLSITVFSIIMPRILLKEKIRKSTVAALGLAFVGLIVLFYPFSIISEKGIFILISMLGGFLIAVNITVSKMAKKHTKYSLLFWQSIIAILILLPAVLLQETANYTPTNTFIAIGISIISLVGTLLLYSGIKHSKAQKVSILSLVGVVIAPIAGYFFFQEQITLQILIGIVILIGSVYLSSLSKKHKKRMAKHLS